MPRKFTRESFVEAARARHSSHYELPRRARLTPRNRLLLVYLGLFAFVLMVLVYEVFAHFVGFGAGTVVHDTGVITARDALTTQAGEAAWRVEVEVVLPDGATQRGSLVVPAAYGANLAVGDRVGVLYRRFAEGILLEQIGAVALPPPAG